MLQATNDANAATSVHPNNAEHSLAQGADPSHQALLSGLTAWRKQGNLQGLVAQHRDVASRLIEQFVNDSHSRTLDLRGLQLQGLPKEIANLRPVLAERGSAAAPAELRIDPEAFSNANERNLYCRFFGGHCVVAQPQASAYAASTSAAGPSALSVPPGNPDQHRQWAACVAAVVGAMREGALPLLDDIVKSLQTLAQREDSTLQTASNFFTTLQAKVNSNISKTNVNKHPVCALPQLDYRNPLAGQERIGNLLINLNSVYGVLQYAKASPLHSADNVRTALERVGHLRCVALFIDKMFDCLYTLRQQPPKLAQDLLNLENTLSELHTQCMKAEVRGQPTEHDVVQLTDQLSQQSEALRQAYMQVSSLKQRLGELAQVELPEGLRGTLPLPQQFENWGLQNNQKIEALQLHKNTSLLLGRLANPNLGLMTITNLCTSLAGQLSKVPENSEYWPLIEEHPRPEVRQLAVHRQQPAKVEKPLEAVHLPHTHVALLTQKDTAFEAAAKGDLKTLHRCLTKGLDPEVRDDQQQTLLHVAAANGRTDLIDWLVNVQKLPLEITSKNGCTPFITAAENGHAVAMAALHDAGANSQAKDIYGFKAVRKAVESGNLDTVKYCVEMLKQPVDEKNSFYSTPLLLRAAACGGRDMLEWMVGKKMANPAIADRDGNKAIHYAVESGNVDTVKYCVETLKQAVDEANSSGTTPLLVAAGIGNRDIMEWLVGQGANPNVADKSGNKAIHKAVESGNLDTVEYCVEILNQPVDEKDSYGRTALLIAAKSGQRGIMEWLVGKGANPTAADRCGHKAIHNAVQFGNLDTVKYSVEILKQPVDDKQWSYHTPLYIAIRGNRRDIVEWLVDNGAKPAATGEYGITAIYNAIQFASFETLEYFVETLNLPLDEKSREGETPLLIAAAYSNPVLMDLFMRNGANPAATDKFGNKAIHIATQSASLGTVQYCVENLNQPVNTRGFYNCTPLLMAAQCGSQDIMRWLISQGADIHAVDKKGHGLLFYAAPNVKAYARSLF